MPQIPTNQSRECRQDVDIYADIDFCRGKASKPGIKPFILAIRKSHITSFPKPGGSAASSMDEFAIITESFTLEDIKDPQTFTFKARKTSYVRFTIGGVYKGTKYKDTCVGEIIYK